jgi:hypothetical protein
MSSAYLLTSLPATFFVSETANEPALAKLTDLTRREQLEQGWTLEEEHDHMVAPGWARAAQWVSLLGTTGRRAGPSESRRGVLNGPAFTRLGKRHPRTASGHPNARWSFRFPNRC